MPKYGKNISIMFKKPFNLEMPLGQRAIYRLPPRRQTNKGTLRCIQPGALAKTR